jgi:branched-chain amino acid transport system substrate-binding protein
MAASARDVAQFAKVRALAGSGMGILCPTWPYTREILLAGGESVEGIIFSTSYTEENDHPAFQDFRKRYEERFGWPPNFAAAYSYEAVKLIAQALRITKGERQGLEQALVSTGHIQGVIGDFALDQAGDVNRENFIVTIRDARFRTVQK